MKIALTVIIGYLLGSLSPAALLGKIKKQDMRSAGTKNLGASNALILLGKGSGIIVMVLDILKGFIAYRVGQALCPSLIWAGFLGGIFAIIGHIYPFYLKFKGGKGLATYGGIVLGFSPLMFLMLLLITLVLIIIINHSAAMPFTAALVFPVLVYYKTQSICLALLALLSGVIIMITHFSNLKKAFNGQDMKIRDIIRKHILKKD